MTNTDETTKKRMIQKCSVLCNFEQLIHVINSLERLVVFSLCVVEQTELQESSAIIVAQPCGWRQILDGFLRVAHPDVTLCAEFP